MKILLAVDGSSFTKRMLGYVAANQDLFTDSTDFTIFTVVPEIPAHPRSFLPRPTVDDYYLSEAAKVLDPVKRFAQQNGWKFEARHAVGHPGDLVAELATNGAFDMVIMGTHGHSALVNVVLGSVAMRVLAQCKVPLLLVR